MRWRLELERHSPPLNPSYHCNEIGFTRANIRSITAIGESTKKKLLTHRSSSIGEKGVGFKTIFAIASKVTIHSGDYHFSLSDKEPTIPKLICFFNIIMEDCEVKNAEFARCSFEPTKHKEDQENGHFSKTVFRNCKFEVCHFADCVFDSAEFIECTFTNTDIDTTNPGVHFTDCEFKTVPYK